MKIIDSIYLGKFSVEIDLVETEDGQQNLLIKNLVDNTSRLIKENELKTLLKGLQNAFENYKVDS